MNRKRWLSEENIGMKHKTEIERLRKKYGHELSAHTFASLFLWQKNMGLHLHLEQEFFTARCKMRGDNVWFFPCGSDRAKAEFLRKGMRTRGFSLCYLRACDVKWLEAAFPGRWEFRREEASDEYICDIAESLALAGSRFAEIRRKLRQIERMHRTETRRLSGATLLDAQAVIDSWEEAPHSTGEGELTDEGVALEALRNCKELELDGILLYLDGKAAALFAGFPSSESTLDVLIGKCVPGTPRGTVYYALWEYMKVCGDGFHYCNQEEDLGIPGIRQLKRSLYPVRKNEIWEAVLR